MNQQTQDQDGSWPNHKIGRISAYNPNIVKISSLYFEIDGPPPPNKGEWTEEGDAALFYDNRIDWAPLTISRLVGL